MIFFPLHFKREDKTINFKFKKNNKIKYNKINTILSKSKHDSQRDPQKYVKFLL